MATPAPPTTRTQTRQPQAVTVANPLRDRIHELATDIGRLRRRTEPDTYTAHLADRLAGHTQALHLLTTPTAGELAATTAPSDEQAVTEAIRVVDHEWRQLQQLLEARP